MKNDSPTDQRGVAPVSLSSWRRDAGISSTTIWRWRRAGWLEVTNIAGRLYLLPGALEKFERRAAAGEFSRHHQVPPPRLAA
ncbi:MAG TPA: hypothetical protein VG167_20210 [Verrucomicrobiae bacterium]|nr:hypothetical protein [Verrucomicrobiae bacterium]